MSQVFIEDTALNILQSKLYGRGPEAAYELTDAELALLRGQLETWVIKLAQFFADRVGDPERANRIMADMINRPQKVREDHAIRAGKIIETGKFPPHREFAAFILANASDQFRIEDEIARRERLQ